MFIGGKQVRSDTESYRTIYRPATPHPIPVGAVCDGSKKDIRNAVEAARNGFTAWKSKTGFNKRQILMYIRKNLSALSEGFQKRLIDIAGFPLSHALYPSISLFSYILLLFTNSLPHHLHIAQFFPQSAAPPITHALNSSLAGTSHCLSWYSSTSRLLHSRTTRLLYPMYYCCRDYPFTHLTFVHLHFICQFCHPFTPPKYLLIINQLTVRTQDEHYHP